MSVRISPPLWRGFYGEEVPTWQSSATTTHRECYVRMDRKCCESRNNEHHLCHNTLLPRRDERWIIPPCILCRILVMLLMSSHCQAKTSPFVRAQAC